MSEVCFCCLSDEADAMINIHSIDKTIKRSYKEMVLEFIEMKFEDAENIVICFECRNVLRKIVSFLEMCRRNNKDRLNDDDKLLDAKDQNENLPEQIEINDTIVINIDLDVVKHDTENKTQIRKSARKNHKKPTKTQTKSKDLEESNDENDSVDGSNCPIVEKSPAENSSLVEIDDNNGIKSLHLIEEDETEENKDEVENKDEFQEEKIVPVDVICSSSSKSKNAKSLLCSDCGQIFATSQRLKIHSFTHSGIKEFKCSEKLANGEVCMKLFATEFRLKTHQRIHLGLKPYKCKFSGCDAAFAQGNALKNHERLHSNLKPYKCTICSKQFVQNTTLKTHMAVHVGKKVPCSWPGCLKKFARISFMKVHLRQVRKNTIIYVKFFLNFHYFLAYWRKAIHLFIRKLH